MIKEQTDRKEVDNQIVDESQSILNKMTLKEKVWLLNGNWDFIGRALKYGDPLCPIPIESNGCERLNITPIRFTDGPRGVVMGNSTCFPVSMARGASFDKDLERRVGDVIGKEARAQGANLYAGVCINLLRHPAWGRSQETYGEDPFHVGEMGKALTEAVQAHNVMACLKHFAVNNIENSRFRVNVKADERTMREIYLPQFKKSVDAGAASIMGAYNLYEGHQCCESEYLLTKVLRADWGFKGFTISDFSLGIRDGIKAIMAGMDVELPMPVHYNKNLLQAVEEGKVPESTIDLSVTRILQTILFFENCPDTTTYSKEMVAAKAHTELAKEVAEKSMVLIKNEKGVLPFRKDVQKVLVIGRLAKKKNTGDRGSSRVRPPYVVTYIQGIKDYFGSDVKVMYCSDNKINKAKKLAAKSDVVIIFAGYDYNEEGESIIPDPESPVFFDEVVAKGYINQNMKFKAFITKRILGLIYKFIGLSKNGRSVGGDRQSLSLQSQMIKMINEVGRINPHTVVTLVGGSMIMTREWDDSVPAILYGWYSGMEGGNALPGILFGDVNPGGKLPFTVPKEESHLPYFSSTDGVITYDLYHGYTLLDKNKIQPAYPFGFGLSYTEWKYDNMKLSLSDNQICIEVTISNTGTMDGEEVVQIYIGIKDSTIDRQRKLLKGFEKVLVKAGEKQKVTIQVNVSELQYFNNSTMQWELENGTYQVYVGGSSDETKLLCEEISL